MTCATWSESDALNSSNTCQGQVMRLADGRRHRCLVSGASLSMVKMSLLEVRAAAHQFLAPGGEVRLHNGA